LYRLPFTAQGYRTVSWLWPTADGRLLVQHEHLLIDALRPEAAPVLDPGEGERGQYRFVFPDGRRASKVDPDANWTVDWWDLQTGLRLSVPGPLAQARNVLWHTLLPDGVTLLTYVSSTKPDGQHFIEQALWDARTGERLGELTPPCSRWDSCACVS